MYFLVSLWPVQPKTTWGFNMFYLGTLSASKIPKNSFSLFYSFRLSKKIHMKKTLSNPAADLLNRVPVCSCIHLYQAVQNCLVHCPCSLLKMTLSGVRWDRTNWDTYEIKFSLREVLSGELQRKVSGPLFLCAVSLPFSRMEKVASSPILFIEFSNALYFASL